MKKLKCINFLGGPGCGKSTIAAGLFYYMKLNHYNVELVTEFAKDKVYEGHLGCLEDQIYIFGKQQRRINRLVNQVEYAITDSPLILSILYGKNCKNSFKQLVIEEFNEYNNINFFLKRSKKYSEIGRVQNENEAKDLDYKLRELVSDYNIKVIDIDILEKNSLEIIIKYIKEEYGS